MKDVVNALFDSNQQKANESCTMFHNFPQTDVQHEDSLISILRLCLERLRKEKGLGSFR